MPRAFDRLTPIADMDPTKGFEFDPGRFAIQLGDVWGLVFRALMEGIENSFKAILRALLPFAENFEELAFDDLIPLLGAFISGLPLVEDVVATIKSILSHIFGGIDLTDLPSPEEIWRAAINTVIAPFNLLLGPNSPLNLANAVGWLTHIDLGSIGRFSPNLLHGGDFNDGTIDEGTGFTREDGGIVAVTADGSDFLLTSEVIRVSKDQVISAGASARFADALSTGDAIAVELVAVVADVDDDEVWVPVSTETLGTLEPDGTSGTWTVLEDEYTVPEGVDGVALQLHVTPDMTSGTARFKSAFIKKTQRLPIPFVDQLQTVLDAAASVVQGIIDRIINAFNNLGELVDINLDVGGVLDAIFGIFDVGLGARSQTSALAARIRALESAANSIVLDFEGPSTTSMPGWTITSSGGGAGAMGPNGKGNLMWHPSGFGNRTQIGRYDGGALSVDNGRMEWILATSPQSYVFDDAYTYICFRMKDSSNYMRVRSGYNGIRIQSVVSGVVTNVGSGWEGNPKAGDAFVLEFGEAGDSAHRHFVLYRNGAPIIDTEDETSPYGADYRRIGAGMETGNRLVITQNIPAGLGVLTASEVL